MHYPFIVVKTPMHRKVAENFYQRKILFDERVHHIDGNPMNFRRENLIIIKKEDHSKLSIYMKKKGIRYPKFPKYLNT